MQVVILFTSNCAQIKDAPTIIYKYHNKEQQAITTLPQVAIRY